MSVFTESDLVALRAQPRHVAARMLLTGEAGPLRRLVAGTYDPPGAAVAYLVFLAYVYGRARGILSGRPGYEARDTLASRVRSAATRSTGLEMFAAELFGPRGVGAGLPSVRGADWLWWREAAAVHGGRWTEQRHRLDDAIAGAGLLIEWLYDPEARAAMAADEEMSDAM